MSKLRTLHKRARRKLFRSIKSREFEAFVFCNRYAPVFEIKHAYFKTERFCEQVCEEAGAGYYNWKYDRKTKIVYYYAGDLFYQLKNRILAIRGKQKYYALQFWTTEDFNRWDEIEYKSHEHILEVISLNGREFHQPTGHFQFSSDNGFSTYYKNSVGFDEMKKLCGGNIIKGKKSEMINVSSEEKEKIKNEFLAKLGFLVKRFRPLLRRELKREQPRVVTYTDDYYAKHLEVQRLNQQKQKGLFEIKDAPF
jgi:hypothetical protein